MPLNVKKTFKKLWQPVYMDSEHLFVTFGACCRIGWRAWGGTVYPGQLYLNFQKYLHNIQPKYHI